MNFNFCSQCSMSNPCAGPLPKIKIPFFLLSTCTDGLISAPDLIMFLPSPLSSNNKKLPHTLNPIPYSEYLYLSGSGFAVNLAFPNKKSPNVKS